MVRIGFVRTPTLYHHVFAIAALLVVAWTSPVLADLFEWEYIDPSNPSLGKQESTTLVSDGAGVDLGPGYLIRGRNFTKAYLIGADLNDAFLAAITFDESDFTGANLTGVDFRVSTFNNAVFDNAVIREASFDITNITADQVYSTLSYQIGDLTGISFYDLDLTGWNFADQNLTGANLFRSTLVGADFNGATINDANLSYTVANGYNASQLYETLSYQTGNLRGVNLGSNDLSGWDFGGKDLVGARFYGASIAGADFSQAHIGGANFGETDISFSQLSSTVDYTNKNLAGISLAYTDLTGFDLSGQDLTDVNFFNATLAGANLTDAIISGAKLSLTTSKGFSAAQLYSTANYASGDLAGVTFYGNNLSGWDLGGKDLSDADFYSTMLTNTDMGGSNLYGARFDNAVMTATDLSGANLAYATFDDGGASLPHRIAELDQVNMRGAVLEHAYFYRTTITDSDLSAADLSYANLLHVDIVNSDLSGSVFYRAGLSNWDLSGVDLSGADMRGVSSLDLEGASSTRNLIYPDSHVAFFDLRAGEAMRIWDLARSPISVEQYWTSVADSQIAFVFDDAYWGSPITFDDSSGLVPTQLGGTLILSFDPDVDLNTVDGATYPLFDWAGADVTGTFDGVYYDGPGMFDLSDLYIGGTITFHYDMPGDLDGDGFVGISDLNLILSNWNQNVGSADLSMGDVSGDGFVGIEDLNVVLGNWNAGTPLPPEELSAVPEPGVLLLLGVGVLGVIAKPRAA